MTVPSALPASFSPAWSQLCARVLPTAAAPLSTQAAPSEEYLKILNRTGPSATATDTSIDSATASGNALRGLSGITPSFYFLCEMPEGAFPKIQSFATLQDIAQALNCLEGHETAVALFYGQHLSLSKLQATEDGRQFRYLFLPDNQVALSGSKLPLRVISTALLPDDIEREQSGWLGDPAAVDSGSYYYEAGSATVDSAANDPVEPDSDSY